MGAVFQRVYVYKRTGGILATSNAGWSTTANDFSNSAFDVEVKKGVQSIKDTFSFRIARPQDIYDTSTPDIEYGDLVTIWFRRADSSFVDADMVIQGVVQNVPLTMGADSKYVAVKGNDFFEEVFAVQIPVSGLEGKQKTWKELLQALLDRFEFNSRNLFWDPSNNNAGNGSPAGVGTKSDGSSFPIKEYATNYTPFNEIVEKLTSNEFTGDGQYVYYITTDGTNRYLTIRHRQESTVLSPTLGAFVEGTMTESISVDRDSDATVNFVVFNAGNDLSGNPTEWYATDLSSIGKVGFKYFYMIEQTADITSTIMQEEAKIDNGANFNWANGNWTSNNHYPTAYPYVWQRWFVAGAAPSSSSATDFDADLRAIAREQGDNRAREFIEQSKRPHYSVKMGFQFRNDFTLGGLYQVTIPTRGLSVKMRLTEVTHRLSGTDISFEEDWHRVVAA